MRTVELPNGDRLHGSYDWSSDCWTVRSDGTSGAAREHWLHAAVRELLRIPRGTVSPQWLLDAVERLARHDTPVGPRIMCRCCGYLTLTEYGGYEICPVCGWEDDPTTIFESGVAGPNHMSLAEARRQFARHGRAGPGPALRPPRPEERP
jgi:hypothetical protein